MTTQQTDALRLAEILEDRYALGNTAQYAAAELRRQHARITELEAQLSAIGAGGVSPLIAAQETEATHLRELAAYRLTVENLEREIAAQQTAQSSAAASDDCFWNPLPCVHCERPQGEHFIGRCYSVSGKTVYTPQPTAQADTQPAPSESQQPAPSPATATFLRGVIDLCTQKGFSPENIEAWDSNDKWIADIWRQARELLAAQADTQPAPVLDEREEFEAWLRSVWTAGYSCPKLDSGKYEHGEAQRFWECWQARASHGQAYPTIDDLCARIKAADDAAADRDYMLDSNDCIAVLRGEWEGPLAMDKPERASHGRAPAGAANAEGDVFRALIKFLLHADDALAFLRCWNEGNFGACRLEWPEAPPSLYPDTATPPRAAQQAPAEASPTAGMNIPQRILHVGGRNNDAGYVEFGSIQAVEALVRQVLRDLPAQAQAQADSVQEDAFKLLDEVAQCFTTDDALPDNLLPRIDAVIAARAAQAAQKEGKA